MPLGHFEAQNLYAVMRNGDNAYGVAIADTLQEWIGREMVMGAVYSTLDRLERKGYLRSSWSDPKAERGGRRKRVYEITGLGEKVLSEYTERFRRISDGWKPVFEGT